ncbi:hypothetical protein HYV83_03750 [Candidatus Woesearchaeota archaeon]|nr:hypothetical protein [Candidatus Woesearchaeota archaeon]
MENSRIVQHAKAPLEKAEAPKEAVFLYSVPTAVLLFDANIKLLQKIKVANPETAITALTRNEWLPEEASAVKKAVADGKAVVVLGFKEDKMPGVSFSQDAKKLASASSAAEDELKKLRDIVISFTKKAVSGSVSDDNLIIQASSSIGGINKAISLLIKCVREWYELYCPEFSAATQNHEEFVSEILASSKAELLRKLKILEKDSMGAAISKGDVDRILAFAATVKGLYDSRDSLVKYLESVMKRHCLNIAAVAGSSTGAELITQAGSLQRLAMLPSSTIQLLGAERELFRHLKDKKQKPPKAGILQGHPLVTSAPKQQQGRIAKLLADKVSIAARVDYFKGKFVGDSLLSDLKKRLQERATSQATAVAGRKK